MADSLLVEVILVDENDEFLGVCEKQTAHRRALRHRAVSVLLFDSGGRQLLQRRAFNKYHSGGLWTNACCTHPRPGEDCQGAAERSLRWELGLEAELQFRGKVVYTADVGDDLIESEVVHLFSGQTDLEPTPNPSEVCSWKWEAISVTRDDSQKHPKLYTEWFKIYMQEYRYWRSVEQYT